MKSAAGLMPAPELLAAGAAVGIGSDGSASNNNQDMFEEMDIAAKLQKFARMDPTALPAQQVVAMATILGARALHMDHQIGQPEANRSDGSKYYGDLRLLNWRSHTLLLEPIMRQS